MSTRFAMAWPAAAKPYPGEVPAPAEAMNAGQLRAAPGVSRAGAHGCTGQRADGEACNGNAGTDGRCARHKAQP